MKTMTRKNFSSITLAVLYLSLLFILTISVSAQPQRNVDFNPDKTLKSNARVNPSTLAMELSVPVAVYPGRGGNSTPVVFDYSSKVWQQRNWLNFAHPSGNLGTTVKPLFAKRTAAGWTSSLGVARIEYPENMNECYVTSGQEYEGEIWNPDANPYAGLYHLKRLHVTLPDGGSYEFRASDTPAYVGTNSCPAWDPVDTYLSVDGSKMRLEVGSSQSTLYMPDGSRYLFSGAWAVYSSAFIDSDGNKAVYNTSTKQWTDTVGRVFTNPLPYNDNYQQDQTVGDQTVTLPGFNGGTTSVTLSWRYLKDPNGGESGLENPTQNLSYPAMYYCDGSSYTQVPGAYLFANADYDYRVCSFGTGYPGAVFNPIVLTKITLANGQNYQFKYNLYGEIQKIIYPTGGFERFAYSYFQGTQWAYYTFDQTNRGVSDRWVSEKGDGTDEVHWTYSAVRTYTNPPFPDPYKVTITNPDGTRSEQLLYDEPDVFAQRPYGFDKARTGRAYDERSYSSGYPGDLLKRNLTKYTQSGPLSGGYSGATRDTRVEKQVSIIFEPGNSYALAQMTETVYDSNSDPAYFAALNPTQIKTYNYIVVSAATAADPATDADDMAALFSSSNIESVKETDYLYDSNYKARNITGLITETRIEDANGNARAKSQVSYDETGSYPILTYGSNPSQWDNPNTNYRGFVTTTKNWTDISGNQYVQTHSQYDSFGNIRKSWDANGNLTQTEYSSTYAYAYPTLVKTPIPDTNGTHGSNAEFSTTTTYDLNTGLSLTITDPNSQVTSMEYNDALYRVTKVTAPNTAQTITEYGAGTSASTRWVKTRIQIEAQKWKESYAWFDGIGRGIKAQQVDSNGDIFVDTEYDNMGRVKKISNPYRTGETVYKTENFYDDMSRITKVKTPDNAEALTAYSLAVSGSQIGTVVTLTDQAGKLHRTITNALGQMTRMDEPNGSNQLGTISSPNQPTVYKYNIIGKMKEVTQGSQQRHFLYDALGRLLRLKQPEQDVNSALNMSGAETSNTTWTVGFTYDGNGNMLTVTDSKNVTTTSTYDGINRIKTKSFSNGLTPTVYSYYDASNVSNSKGKLTKVTSSVSETRYTAFDSIGKLTASEQTTNGQTYSSGYKYNLGGNLIEQTYPSGRVVKTFLNNEGNLSGISSKVSNGEFKTYAANFSYTASNAIKHLQIGNGLWESAVLNTRQQVTTLRLGTSSTDGSKWTLTNDYGELDGSGNVDATKNAGNIAKQTISLSGLAQPFIQTYLYDSLDRVTEGKEKNNGNQTWKQTFGYDRYGNRTGFTQDIGGQQLTINNLTLPQIDANTNRFVSAGGYNYGYDANGNLTLDAEGRQFTFDGDNKQTEVKNSSNVLVGRYYYDGNGKRVKKIEYDQYGSEKEITIFVYDGMGNLVSEASTAALVSNPTVNYTATDTLGSPRVITNKLGEVLSRRDFMPYGEKLAPDATYRTTALKYTTSDNVRQKFTGYQRDDETGLDFAEARYYYNKYGRFTAVDPLLASGKSVNPQTFNRYVYAMNRPLKLVDTTGLQAGSPPGQNGNYQLKRNLGITGYTYKPIMGETRAEYQKTPDGPIIEVKPKEKIQVGEQDVVPTNSAVNEIVNKYASAVYTNEVTANSAIGAVNEASGAATVKSITLGTGVDFGVAGKDAGNVTGSVSASVTVEITNTESIDAARRDADTKLQVDARNQLREVTTEATGSPNTPRKLSENEISGLLNSAAKIATDAARKDVEAAEESRKRREQQNPPRNP